MVSFLRHISVQLLQVHVQVLITLSLVSITLFFAQNALSLTIPQTTSSTFRHSSSPNYNYAHHSFSSPLQRWNGGRTRTMDIVMMGQRGKRIKKEIKKEREMETPPRIQTPYGPIRFNRPLAICDACSGRGVVRCNVCEGRGVIRATGHRKRNALVVNRAVGSRWTSVDIRCGHRHYVVSEVKGSRKKKNLELRMSNSCGPEEKRVHLWISEDEIRDKGEWRMGWVTLEEILQADKGPLIDAKVCFRCKGECVIKCVECDGMGKTGYHQVLYD
mmetsp:Transcript_15800/g.23747  ORF Transcript_15800/g.23747 Transcript_15800/m.23747 type:complete len:273 (+) Transcript_15800:137-955(+)